MIHKILCVAAVILFISTTSYAQGPPDPKPAIDAVGKLAFLVGHWSGDGWIQMGPGPKHLFNQDETVESKLDGAAITIEGVGFAKEDTDRKIHQAIAVLAFDPVGGNLTFSSFVAGRPRLDVIPEVDGQTMIWGFSPPNGGNVRYKIVVENDTWHEIGEWSADGENWRQFFEMNLTKE